MNVEERMEILRGESYLLYGRPKIMKSSFAGEFPKPVYIATEPGLKYKNPYGDDKAKNEACKKYVYSWREYLELINKLLEYEHDYFTWILDTGDKLESMCKEYICDSYGKDHPSEIGSQGKGWNLVTNELEKGLAKLLIHAQKNKGCVIILCHASMKEVKTKKDEEYSFVTLNLSGKNVGILTRDVEHMFYVAPGKDKSERYIYTYGGKFFETGSRNMNLASKQEILISKSEKEGGKIKVSYYLDEFLKAHVE